MTRRIIRNTKQRNLLLECFKNNKDRHLTVEELYEMAKSIDSNIGIATVYRNVKLLEEQGVINKIELPDFLLAYEMCAFNSEHSHHHLICRKCGNIVDFEEDLLETIEKKIKDTKNFTITDHRVIFYGYCKACADEMAKKPVQKPEDSEQK
jgi:Fur family ferric uptake transcriptional regulator